MQPGVRPGVPPAVGSQVGVRGARTGDVWAIRDLVDRFARQRVLLQKATVTLFEDLPEFRVAEVDGRLAGCAALHVLWEDLGEVRTLAVDPEFQGRGVGSALLTRLVDDARAYGISRLFCLTFAVDFFARHGFVPIGEQPPVEPEVYAELLRSYDEGVAEFLELERVKPNTLGNTRMLLDLRQPAGAQTYASST